MFVKKVENNKQIKKTILQLSLIYMYNYLHARAHVLVTYLQDPFVLSSDKITMIR